MLIDLVNQWNQVLLATHQDPIIKEAQENSRNFQLLDAPFGS